MIGHFKAAPPPETRLELARALEDAFLALTGRSIWHPQHFVMVRHAHGGMSSGGISPEFWREHGISLLLSRFDARHAAVRQPPAAPESEMAPPNL